MLAWVVMEWVDDAYRVWTYRDGQLRRSVMAPALARRLVPALLRRHGVSEERMAGLFTGSPVYTPSVAASLGS